jgi:hypothetical protein
LPHRFGLDAPDVAAGSEVVAITQPRPRETESAQR